MDGALRVDDHLDLLHGDSEEVTAFDDLKALVHHRGGIHRDLGSHRPRRMAQSLT